jgi:hypothetical protein
MDPSYLIFDLETVGKPLTSFDAVQQEYLLRGTETDEDRAKKINEFGLSPMTGFISCIGMQMMTRVGQEWQAKRVAYSRRRHFQAGPRGTGAVRPLCSRTFGN